MISLATIKTSLGISDTSFDDYLNLEISLITRAINNYCRRDFVKKDHTQIIKLDNYRSSIYLEQYPINSISSFTIDSEVQDYERFTDSGELISNDKFRPGLAEITYNSGFDEADLDPMLFDIFMNIITTRYRNKISDQKTNSQKDIKRFSITGVMTVEYNKRDQLLFNDYLEGYQDALDFFRCERGYFS